MRLDNQAYRLSVARERIEQQIDPAWAIRTWLGERHDVYSIVLVNREEGLLVGLDLVTGETQQDPVRVSGWHTGESKLTNRWYARDVAIDSLAEELPRAIAILTRSARDEPEQQPYTAWLVLSINREAAMRLMGETNWSLARIEKAAGVDIELRVDSTECSLAISGPSAKVRDAMRILKIAFSDQRALLEVLNVHEQIGLDFFPRIDTSQERHEA